MRLRLMQLNAQDLFLQLAYDVTPADLPRLAEEEWQLLGVRDVAVKPLVKLRGLARLLADERPDVVCVNEVGGPESLQALVRLFLADSYVPFCVRGNDGRGIDNGFL